MMHIINTSTDLRFTAATNSRDLPAVGTTFFKSDNSRPQKATSLNTEIGTELLFIKNENVASDIRLQRI